MVLSKIGLALLGSAGLIAASGCASDNGPRSSQRSAVVQVRPTPPAHTFYRRHNTAAFGTVYLNANGQALYVRQGDRMNRSNCYGTCARQWPPYLAHGNAQATGRWSIITRRDGTRQWAYAGRPTYMWSGDRQQGQVSGNRHDGSWSVLRASPN